MMHQSFQAFFVILGEVSAALLAALTIWRYVIRPAVVAVSRIAQVYEQVDNLSKQFQRNGGLSLRDAIDRIEAIARHQEERMRVMLGMVPFAITETDAAGGLVYANRTYLRWTGREEYEVHGDGWVNAVDPRDRHHVVTEWRDAVLGHRSFESRFRLLDANGKPFIVYARAIPLRTLSGTISGYLAIIARCVGSEECPMYLDGGTAPNFSCVWNGCSFMPSAVDLDSEN